ncbi:Zn-ribbon domain-containing OB-fold protein [Streptomyces sp. NPDC058382]|uniref:Zn-ribbon domain-containing OB-fold protein n=1 Tax=unclassified Streptomyces TaxID=2593676 RepID=UPI0036383186
MSDTPHSRHEPTGRTAPPLLPAVDALTGAFYDWLARGELRVQRCLDCAVLRHVPRHLCPACGSDEADWMACTGHGVLFSWTTTHRALHPAHARTPFTTAVITLDEGPRLVVPLVGARTEELRPGLPVQLDLAARPESGNTADGIVLPVFRPTSRHRFPRPAPSPAGHHPHQKGS